MLTAIVERTYTDLTFKTYRPYDDDADVSWIVDAGNYLGEPESDIEMYLQQDQERLDAYNNGEWHMVGVHVVAILTGSDGRDEEFSHSLWGIESDSDEGYFREVEEELTRELIHDLHHFGIEDDFIAAHSLKSSLAYHIATERDQLQSMAAD